MLAAQSNVTVWMCQWLFSSGRAWFGVGLDAKEKDLSCSSQPHLWTWLEVPGDAVVPLACPWCRQAKLLPLLCF